MLESLIVRSSGEMHPNTPKELPYVPEVAMSLEYLERNLPVGSYFIMGSTGRAFESTTRPGSIHSFRTQEPLGTYDVDIAVREGTIPWKDLTKVCAEAFEAANRRATIDPKFYKVETARSTRKEHIIFQRYGWTPETPLTLPIEWFKPIAVPYHGQTARPLDFGGQFLLMALPQRVTPLRQKDLPEFRFLFNEIEQNPELRESPAVAYGITRMKDHLFTRHAKLARDASSLARVKLHDYQLYRSLRRLAGRKEWVRKQWLGFDSAEPRYLGKD